MSSKLHFIFKQLKFWVLQMVEKEKWDSLKALRETKDVLKIAMNFRIPTFFMLSVDIGVGANPVQFHLLLKLVIDVLSHDVSSEPFP